jgi:electron transport complex protein RnfA
LGVAILCIRRELSFLEAIVFAIASASGFTLALVLLAGIRERLEISDVPKSLRGTAIGLIMAGMMALAFFAFVGVDASLKALLYK